jgi:hypothetical protein
LAAVTVRHGSTYVNSPSGCERTIWLGNALDKAEGGDRTDAEGKGRRLFPLSSRDVLCFTAQTETVPHFFCAASSVPPSKSGASRFQRRGVFELGGSETGASLSLSVKSKQSERGQTCSQQG